MQNIYPGSHKGVNFVILTRRTKWGSWIAEAEISYPAARQTITLLTVLSHIELQAKLHVDETEAVESARRDACRWIERELAGPAWGRMAKRKYALSDPDFGGSDASHGEIMLARS